MQTQDHKPVPRFVLLLLMCIVHPATVGRRLFWWMQGGKNFAQRRRTARVLDTLRQHVDADDVSAIINETKLAIAAHTCDPDDMIEGLTVAADACARCQGLTVDDVSRLVHRWAHIRFVLPVD